MVARIVTFFAQPDKLDELVSTAAGSVIPLMQQEPGCRLITFLAERGTNKVMAVGFWDSEVDVQRNEQSGVFQEQLNKVKPLLAAPPQGELLEVSVQTAPI